MTATPGLRLRPVLDDWASRVLSDSKPLLHDLAYGLGGPYHVLHPPQFTVNAHGFTTALTEAQVAGTVYYAKKANKAACWITAAAETGLGIDVASADELRDALGHGLTGDRLVVTGPAKSAELLSLAALHGSLVAVDSLDELDHVITVGRRLRPVRAMLRCLPAGQPHSRFGLDDPELDKAVARCAESADAVRLEGFSFHLSGYDLGQRTDQAAQLVQRCVDARAAGLPVDRISIGGGLPIGYLRAEDWATFDANPRHFHGGRTFGGFYPYHSPVTGPDALRTILTTHPAGHHETLAELLRTTGVQLLVEPGRALLDQAGFTVFAVHGVKERQHGIVTVNGTSFSLSEQWFDSDYLVDPLLLPREHDTAPAPFITCVGGASCLETDMLTWRKVTLPHRPRPGDLLIYANTAGYQMDSNESEFHHLPLPPKVVLDHDGDTLRWRLDRPAGRTY